MSSRLVSFSMNWRAQSNLYILILQQVSREVGSRRPPCSNLYDVFCNIRDDEEEHVHTMQACQNYAISGAAIQSPHDRL